MDYISARILLLSIFWSSSVLYMASSNLLGRTYPQLPFCSSSSSRPSVAPPCHTSSGERWMRSRMHSLISHVPGVQFPDRELYAGAERSTYSVYEWVENIYMDCSLLVVPISGGATPCSAGDRSSVEELAAFSFSVRWAKMGRSDDEMGPNCCCGVYLWCFRFWWRGVSVYI